MIGHLEAAVEQFRESARGPQIHECQSGKARRFTYLGFSYRLMNLVQAKALSTEFPVPIVAQDLLPCGE